MMQTDSQGVRSNSVSSLSDSNCDDSEGATTLRGRPCAKRKNERDEEISYESFSENSMDATRGEPKRCRLETPMYSDDERHRVVEILEQEFNKELQSREEEALLIEERIQRAQRTLHYLCYAVVSDFYSRDKTITQQVTSTRQRRIHPAVKELLAGKHPKDSNVTSSSSTESSNQTSSSFKNIPSQEITARTPLKTKKNAPTLNSSTNTESSASTTLTKVPRYIPPKPKDSPGKSGGTSRGMHNKVKQRIVIGNVSKYLPVESREDSATHKWMVYVRGPKDAADVSGFVEKVRFFLHPSYRPNDVVQVVQAPFHLSRRGWGEFPVRVQIHFHDPLNKPVDVIHHLKLDRTCTGLQTLGAETVVDVWINKNNNIRTVEQPELVLSPVSQELEEIFPKFDKGEDDLYGQLPSSPPSLDLRTTEVISSAAVPNGENTAGISLLQRTTPNVSESSNVRKDFVSTTKKTDGDENQPTTPVSAPGRLVLSPLKQLVKSTSPSSKILVSSPSKIVLKPATSEVLVSSPSKVQLRPTTPGVSPGKQTPSPLVVQLQRAAPVVSSGVMNSTSVVAQLKQTASVTETSKSTTTILRPILPVTSSKILVDSPSNIQLKTSTRGVLVSSPGGQAKPIPGVIGNSSKVLILNRPALVSKPTTTSAIKSDVLSSSISNMVSAPKLVTASSTSVPNRLTEALQSNKTLNVPGTKIIQSADSPAKILIQSGGSGSSTSGGQLIKVVSPNCVTSGSAKAASAPLAAKTILTNQNALGVPTSKTSSTFTKPVSLVKYKAPDGSIRFLQVSQINQPNSKPAVMSQSQTATSVPQNESNTASIPTRLVRPTNEAKLNAMPGQRNPSPLIRLPAPSNVTPTSNSGHVLMFRNGKVYLVRPSPTISTAATPANQIATIRQPALQTVVPQTTVLSVSNPSTPPSVKPERAPQFVPPCTVAVTSMPALVNTVNTVRAVPTSKLMPDLTQRPRGSQGAQRQGVSLLKSNVLQQSPASSPSVSPVNSPGSSPMHPSAKAISHRVILPRPTISPVSSSTYRTKLYKQMLSTVVRSCPTKSCAGGVGRAIRWMVRNLPLICSEARHSEYQVLHPYCAPDADTFLNWNLGKQRACELMRAQTVWRLLHDVGWDENDLWTVREILIWARFHGYTPGLPLTDSGSGVESSAVQDVCNYRTIDKNVTEWLDKQENVSAPASADVESSEEELDVVSENLSPSKVRVKQEPSHKISNCLADPVENMPLEEPLLGAGAFVNEVLNNVGIQLEPEQLVTGVRYPAAQRILVQAVQSLIDDLVRRSLAKAWSSNIARSPRSIELPHVCSAILSRPEFDFLSCAGLGVNSVPSTSGGTSTGKVNFSNPS